MSHVCAGRFFFVAAFIISQAWSLAIPGIVTEESPGFHDLTRRTNNNPDNPNFKFRKYEEFQISDGVAGNSLQNAVLVFMEPFGLVFDPQLEIGPPEKLAAVSKTDLANLKTMAKVSSDNEKPGFVKIINQTKNKEIKNALKVGMTANKVLKLVGQQVYLAIDLAQGKQENRKKLDDEKKKVKVNIELDIKNKGKPMVSYLHPDCLGKPNCR